MVLQLVKMGCDFDAKYNAKELEFSDLENHRLRLHFTDKKGQRVLGDVCCWDTVQWQISIKKADKTWKPFIDAPHFAIAPDLSVYQIHTHHASPKFGKDVGCFRYGDYAINSNEDMRKVKYAYTKKGLLAFVNSLANEEYTDIEFVPYTEQEKWTAWQEEQRKELKATIGE